MVYSTYYALLRTLFAFLNNHVFNDIMHTTATAWRVNSLVSNNIQMRVTFGPNHIAEFFLTDIRGLGALTSSEEEKI